ncbi:hypothetical protein B9T33_07385 [Acinetobacter sp. ANC 5054]|uniref:hypothetical protein n=1 Tax=Acinetobacter sp. ANC 5054 TaxID=1977877 RepID=UPI000A335BEC|nr:hypothetical protein [Acinetobacter sp. ANC 5054]OTG81475.1 hypothetical protein B9T33_07385 [Acinetobacter sp. ANC 5054]
MKKINTWICIGLMSTLSSLSFANVQSLQKQESQVLQKFKQQNFYEVNVDIESAVVDIISADQSSFNYDFPALTEQGYVRIQYSPDKKLKFYTFDISGGGTMGEWDSYVQYYTGKTQHVDQFDSGSINQIQPVRINNKVVYLVRSYYKGDSCSGMHHVRAVEVGPKQLLKSYVFKTKQKNLDEISVDYDCHYDQDRSSSQNYLKVGPKHVDVMLLNENYQPQQKYLRYSLGSKGYVYQGIVK